MGSLKENLQTVLDRSVAAGEIAGANVLILQQGKELAYVQSGYADVEEKKPFQRDTITRLYSMSKPVTAAAVMLLMERGLLDIGQQVGDILPAYRNLQVWENGRKVPARTNMLISDLLKMTSGMPYGGPDPAGQEAEAVFAELDSRLFSDRPMTTLEIAERLGCCGLSFHPGQRWMYGTSADILGAVTETVSGMRFGAFLKENLFDPLGMEDTGFYVPAEKQHRLAQAYEQTPQGVKRFETNHLGIGYPQRDVPAFESGGAGLVSTAEDYAKFATMLIRGGEGILSRASVERMTKNMLLPWQQESLWHSWDSLPGYGYGSLMRIMEHPGMSNIFTWKGEYGWDGWLGCYFCNSPENGISMVMTCQRRDAGTLPVTRRLRNVLAASI